VQLGPLCTFCAHSCLAWPAPHTNKHHTELSLTTCPTQKCGRNIRRKSAGLPRRGGNRRTLPFVRHTSYLALPTACQQGLYMQQEWPLQPATMYKDVSTLDSRQRQRSQSSTSASCAYRVARAYGLCDRWIDERNPHTSALQTMLHMKWRWPPTERRPQNCKWRMQCKN
jgi:hypothetical protein